MMKASVYISLAQLTGYILGNKFKYITYVVSVFFISHSIYYIIMGYVFYNDWDRWTKEFYDYALLIPGIMLLSILIHRGIKILISEYVR